MKYHSAGTEPAGFDQQKDCSSQLTIWDGAAPDADLDKKVQFTTYKSFVNSFSGIVEKNGIIFQIERENYTYFIQELTKYSISFKRCLLNCTKIRSETAQTINVVLILYITVVCHGTTQFYDSKLQVKL